MIPVYPGPATGSLFVTPSDGVLDIAAAGPAAAYYGFWATDLVVNLPASPGSTQLAVAILISEDGLGIPTFTVEGGGVVSPPSRDADLSGGGYVMFLSPAPFPGVADWTYVAVPTAA